MPTVVNAYGVKAPGEAVVPLKIKRRDMLNDDVRIEIQWAGICASDIHYAKGGASRNESYFPLVPGHEIVGRAIEIGPKVTQIHVGDEVMVGCLVDKCGECQECLAGHEHYCQRARIQTYNSVDPYMPGQATYGGYSEQIIVKEFFVLRIPQALCSDPVLLRGVAPIGCAGITMWAPLRQYGVGPGSRVGIVALGGLGHIGVKLASALGAEVTVIYRTHDLDADARKFGASRCIDMLNAEEMAAAEGSLDVILDTVPCEHDFNALLRLVHSYGTLHILGYFGEIKSNPLQTLELVWGSKSIASSLIGSMEDTRELLEFCGKHKIAAQTEVVQMKNVNAAWQRVDRSEVRYRLVIDVAEFRIENFKS